MAETTTAPPVKPVSAAEYWAALDALTKAREIEETKYQAIVRAEPGAREAMAAWWRVAEPRWKELETLCLRAEAEDWGRAVVRYWLWKAARAAGKAPGTVDAPAFEPKTPGEARADREATTRPRRIEKAGEV